MDSFYRDYDSMDQCNLWTLDRVDIVSNLHLHHVFFFVRKASSIAVPKMTLQDIVKQESELKCYIDMLALSHSSAPFPMCYTDTVPCCHLSTICVSGKLVPGVV